MESNTYTYPRYYFNNDPQSTIKWAYSINNTILTQLSSCRTNLSEALAEDFHAAQKFQSTNPEILLKLPEKFWKNFQSNIDWFNLWQKHLGFSNLCIKENKTPISIVSMGTNTPSKLNNTYVIQIDHRWFKMGTMHNTVVTFVLKLMMLVPHLPLSLNKDILYKDINHAYNKTERSFENPDEIEYLETIGWNYFLFLLNHIHNIKQKNPFGNKYDSWIERHVNSGFVGQSKKIKAKYNTTNLLTLTLK